MKRLIFEAGGSSKFWEAESEGAVLRIRFGKTGTAGQTQEKSFASAEAAQRELEKRAAEKLARGYRALDDQARPSPAPSPTSAPVPAPSPTSASAPAPAPTSASAPAPSPTSEPTPEPAPIPIPAPAPTDAPRPGSAEREAVVRRLQAAPSSPAATHLAALTSGDEAAALDALVALNDVAAAAGDGALYHAVLFALAAFDDDRAWACLRAWLDAWRAANAPDERGSPLGTGVELMLRVGPPPRVLATLGPHVADFRDGRGPRPIAARALQEAALALRRGATLDPGWFELAASMLDSHAELAAHVQTIVTLTDHPRRLELLLERAAAGKAWRGLYEGLGRLADDRAVAVLRPLLAAGSGPDVVDAARGLAWRGAHELAPLVIDAVCRVIGDGGRHAPNLNALRDALLPLARAADAPKLRAAAKRARAAEGFTSARERTEFARDVDGLAKLIAART